MIQTLIHTSDNNNLYIFDDQSRLTMLIHPEFKKASEGSSDADSYYLQKYEYFKKHGFFSPPKVVDFGTLDESLVENNITNTKQVVFEVTDDCNLNCAYCSLGELYKGHYERIGRKININYAINLLEYIFNIKPKNTKLFISFYGGEPLLNMDSIKRIVEVSKKLNIEKQLELEYTMTTNATLIHKHIDFLVANNFIILISLDGNEKNHSYRVMQKNNKNSFSVVIKNIDMIQRVYPEYFKKCIQFNAVLHDRNSVKEIHEFIFERYNKIPGISELRKSDTKSDNEDVLKKMYRSIIKSEGEFQDEKTDMSVYILRENSIKYGQLADFLKFFTVNYYLSNINALLYSTEKLLPSCTCIPFQKKIFLTTRNKLLLCERINYDYYMGTIDEKIEIDIPRITKKFNSYLKRIKNSCKTCYAHRYCGTCIFHLKDLENGDSKEIVCERHQDQESFKNKLNGVISFLEKNPSVFSEILENLVYQS